MGAVRIIGRVLFTSSKLHGELVRLQSQRPSLDPSRGFRVGVVLNPRWRLVISVHSNRFAVDVQLKLFTCQYDSKRLVLRLAISLFSLS